MALNSQFILIAAAAIAAVIVIVIFSMATEESDPSRLADALAREYDDLAAADEGQTTAQ
jgi:hypothetical protein